MKPAKGKQTSETGIIFNVIPYGDEDIIVHLLTETLGRISAIGRRARKNNKNFPGGLDLFDKATFAISPPAQDGGIYKLLSLGERTCWINLRRRLKTYKRASSIAEITSLLTTDGDAAISSLYLPLLECLQNLSAATEDQKENEVWIKYTITALNQCGYSPLEFPGLFSQTERSVIRKVSEKQEAEMNKIVCSEMIKKLCYFIEQEISGAKLRFMR